VEQFAGVPDPDRAKIIGGNLAKIVGFDDSFSVCRNTCVHQALVLYK
jgi:hypothetical protein